MNKGSDPTESEVTKMLDTKTEQKWPLTIVDGIAKGHFFLARNEKGALPHGNAPTQISYHSQKQKSTFTHLKITVSPFYTIYPEVFCVLSPLAKVRFPWYTVVIKEVAPDVERTPVDRIQHLPFYIYSKREECWRTELPRKGLRSTESGRLRWKRGYPMIEPKTEQEWSLIE